MILVHPLAKPKQWPGEPTGTKQPALRHHRDLEVNEHWFAFGRDEDVFWFRQVVVRDPFSMHRKKGLLKLRKELSVDAFLFLFEIVAEIQAGDVFAGESIRSEMFEKVRDAVDVRQFAKVKRFATQQHSSEPTEREQPPGVGAGIPSGTTLSGPDPD